MIKKTYTSIKKIISQSSILRGGRYIFGLSWYQIKRKLAWNVKYVVLSSLHNKLEKLRKWILRNLEQIKPEKPENLTVINLISQCQEKIFILPFSMYLTAPKIIKWLILNIHPIFFLQEFIIINIGFMPACCDQNIFLSGGQRNNYSGQGGLKHFLLYFYYVN